MNLHDPSNRLGKPVPFAEGAQDFTLEGAKAASQNCERCCGEGFATIYNPNYTGSAIGYEFDRWGMRKQILMRTMAFCVCPAGRKIAMLNQQDSKDFFLRTPDLHDVFSSKHHAWVADDPTERDAPPIDVDALPEQVRRLATAMRIPRIYQEPEPDPRDEINRAFDDGAAI